MPKEGLQSGTSVRSQNTHVFHNLKTGLYTVQVQRTEN